jgi:hypothetical protein
MSQLLFLALFLIASTPLLAQDPQPDAAELKEDAQKVVTIISGDKAKTQTFCQMEILGNQIDEAIKKQDTKKAYELTQKLTELEKDLGSEYLALVERRDNTKYAIDRQHQRGCGSSMRVTAFSSSRISSSSFPYML